MGSIHRTICKKRGRIKSRSHGHPSRDTTVNLSKMKELQNLEETRKQLDSATHSHREELERLQMERILQQEDYNTLMLQWKKRQTEVNLRRWWQIVGKSEFTIAGFESGVYRIETTTTHYSTWNHSKEANNTGKYRVNGIICRNKTSRNTFQWTSKQLLRSFKKRTGDK